MSVTNDSSSYSISKPVYDWTLPTNVDIERFNRETRGIFDDLLKRPANEWPPGGTVIPYTNYGKANTQPEYISSDNLSGFENYLRRKLLEASFAYDNPTIYHHTFNRYNH